MNPDLFLPLTRTEFSRSIAVLRYSVPSIVGRAHPDESGHL